MKERYIQIMDRVVDAYSLERIDEYIFKAKTSGIQEHGFPRLCANIGILIAHGRKLQLKSRFEEMMTLCCEQMPVCGDGIGTRGNDFSVREILSCILELEQAECYCPETIGRWKSAMASIVPEKCYRVVAAVPPKPVDNWAAFNAASEQLRCKAGLAHTESYIENQIASQMLSFDENGMYRDPNEPVVYDLVPRNMLAACLFYGYNGKYKEALEATLRKAGDYTLLMQSVTGELPYGGRSNQFIHTETQIAVCCEFQAACRKKAGDIKAAGQFKAAAKHALDCIEHWLDIAPGQHIKNYFPIDTKIGCEKYAYYDKYMVTIASFLYLAYCMADDSIAPTSCPAIEDASYTWATSNSFHKLFCKSGPYFVELDTAADPHYDASGIGRVHRRGAPSTICLSVPGAIAPKYTIDKPNPIPLAICCGAKGKGCWKYGFDEGAAISILSHHSDPKQAYAKMICILPDRKPIYQDLILNAKGLTVEVRGQDRVCMTLPAFVFDGMTQPEINPEKNSLSIAYQGWKCTYLSSGDITDMGYQCTNRNGIYQIFQAEAENILTVHIQIEPIE